MKSKSQQFLMRVLMAALVVFLVMPVSALAQGRGRDNRDGRWDGNNQQRNRDRDRDNDEWRRNQGRDDRWRRNDDNNRNRRGRDWDGRGGHGGSFQLRQTALNAGYNNGIEEGRKDRRRGDRFDYRDEGDYQKATEDYSSRLGDRELYRRYFREGFANGYRTGYSGY